MPDYHEDPRKEKKEDKENWTELTGDVCTVAGREWLRQERDRELFLEDFATHKERK